MGTASAGNCSTHASGCCRRLFMTLICSKWHDMSVASTISTTRLRRSLKEVMAKRYPSVSFIWYGVNRGWGWGWGKPYNPSLPSLSGGQVRLTCISTFHTSFPVFVFPSPLCFCASHDGPPQTLSFVFSLRQHYKQPFGYNCEEHHLSLYYTNLFRSQKAGPPASFLRPSTASGQAIC